MLFLKEVINVIPKWKSDELSRDRPTNTCLLPCDFRMVFTLLINLKPRGDELHTKLTEGVYKCPLDIPGYI